MQAKDDKGVLQRWAVEWAGTAQLSTAGVNKESLKVGDEIVVTARPSRVRGRVPRADGQPAAAARRVQLGIAWR